MDDTIQITSLTPFSPSGESVRGYVKPTASFHTLVEWETLAYRLLELQKKGIDSRGGKLSCKHMSFCEPEEFDEFVRLISYYFGYQFTVEVERWELLTRKNMLDFVEDFVNHRVWGLRNEYAHYFNNIDKLRFAYFYSRGDLEPYVMLDNEYTRQVHGSNMNPRVVFHFTSMAGLGRLRAAIQNKQVFDISTFTVAEREFFRPESNIVVKLLGNVQAAFRSDVKSMALDEGQRACNMYRLEYPGHEVNNICYDIDECFSGPVKTNLWNELIVTPLEVLDVERLDV
jgi:hypothetical protein